MMAHLRRTAADLGLPLGDRKHTYNSRLAQELGCWADKENMGDLFHNAAFRAYFVHGKNIARIPVLQDLAASVGLSGKEAGNVLEQRSFKSVVDRDWALSRQKGIAGVPAFVMGNEKLVGAQPYETLERFVRAHGVKKTEQL